MSTIALMIYTPFQRNDIYPVAGQAAVLQVWSPQRLVQLHHCVPTFVLNILPDESERAKSLFHDIKGGLTLLLFKKNY